MSDEFEITCPVCRAKQSQQPTCRRCGADLKLFNKAMHSLREAKLRAQEAYQNRDPQLIDVARYLHWLSPVAARAYVEKDTADQADSRQVGAEEVGREERPLA